ncbi:hypothetical protein [Actinomadura craniellae]|nr:hypothetical protein [Actinomadura craniellae]
MSPTSQSSLLDAGLAPLGGPEPDGADVVRARRYSHPQLGGRPVVRLTGDLPAPGEDRALGFLGFAAPATGEPLAYGRRRGLGYPAWALVHDPKNADRALAVVTPMERAARLARSRPGAATDAFHELAARLPHAHLPSYWEQAGRAFLAGGNVGPAAVLFGKAREAELVYALPVDETVRRDVFLEFAFAGALPVKAIKDYFDELRRRYDPARAYAEFTELALRRTLGGLPPWSDLPKQLRALAKAAGLDARAEDDRLAEALLATPAVKEAPAGFFKAYRAALVRVGRADPAVRGRLLNLFPKADSDGFTGWWLELLEEAGAHTAHTALTDGDAPAAARAEGGPGRWLGRMVSHVQGGWRGRRIPDELYALVPRMAGRLRAEGEPVDLSIGRRTDADLVDLCLSLEIPLADPEDDLWFDLSRRHPAGHRRDLAVTDADPRFRPVLDRSVDSFCTRSNKIGELLDSPVLTRMAARWLRGQIAGLSRGGLLEAGRAARRIDTAVDGPTLRALPEEAALLASADRRLALMRTVRLGTPGELGWPEFDAVVAELGGPEKVQCIPSWPVITVTGAGRAVVVGPAGRVAEHDLRVPPSTEHLAVYCGGRLLVCWWDRSGNHAYWSDAPHEVFTPESGEGTWSLRWSSERGSGFCVLTADGARMGDGRPLYPGDRRVPGGGHVLHDGATYWAYRHDPRGLYEIDPATGQRGRGSLPAFLEDAPLAEGEDWVPAACSLAPLPAGLEDTPLGHAGGMVGFRVHHIRGGHRITGVDGRTADVPGDSYAPWGILSVPGGAQPIVLRAAWRDVTALVPGDGDLWELSLGHDHRTGTFVPPPAFWHLFQARDAAASAVLRELTGEQAGALLDAALADRAEKHGDDEDPTPRLRAAVAALLPDGAHPALVAGVVATVVVAADTERYRAGVLERAEARSGPRIDPEAQHQALRGLGGHPGHWTADDILGEAARASRFLLGGPAPGEPVSDWPVLPGRVGALAWRAASPLTSATDRTTLGALLEHWAGLVFADPAARLRRGRSARSHPAAGEHAGGRHLVLGTVEGEPDPAARHYVELRSGDGPPPPEVEPLDAADLTPGWGTRDRIHAFLAALGEHGPAAWDPRAVDLLTERTGLTRGTAALLLAALPDLDDWRTAYLTAEQRKLLGLGAAEAAAARQELRRLPVADRLALLEAAMPGDPAELWDTGILPAAERLAAAWVHRFGRRVPIPEDAVTEAAQIIGSRDAAPLLALLTDPGSIPWLTGGAGRLVDKDDDGAQLAAPQEAPGHNGMAMMVIALLWAATARPVGDPLTAHLPELLDRARARLGRPDLLVPVGLCYGLPGGPGDESPEDTLRRVFGDRRYPGLKAVAHDDGVTVAVARNYGFQLYVRVARLGDDDPRALLATALLTEEVHGGRQLLQALALVRAGGLTALARRVRDTPVPAGGHEANPALSVPGLVAEVAAEHGLSGDAAALYLQLLALLEPTDRNVRRWNGWTPARHKKAVAELTGAGLVLAAKRSRAGRSVFLPGDWAEAAAPNLPVERWKAEMYGLSVPAGQRKLSGPLRRFLPLRPLHELFEHAWARVRSGDLP